MINDNDNARINLIGDIILAREQCSYPIFPRLFSARARSDLVFRETPPIVNDIKLHTIPSISIRQCFSTWAAQTHYLEGASSFHGIQFVCIKLILFYVNGEKRKITLNSGESLYVLILYFQQYICPSSEFSARSQ